VQDNSWKNLVRSACHRSRIVFAIVVVVIVAIVFVRRAISDNRHRYCGRCRHRRSERIERQVMLSSPMSPRLAAVIFAVAIASSSIAAERPEARKIDTGLGDFKVVFKVFQDCSKAQVSRW